MLHSSYGQDYRNEFLRSGELYCSICGHLSDGIQFKKGYICNKCLEYVKALK